MIKKTWKKKDKHITKRNDWSQKCDWAHHTCDGAQSCASEQCGVGSYFCDPERLKIRMSFFWSSLESQNIYLIQVCSAENQTFDEIPLKFQMKETQNELSYFCDLEQLKFRMCFFIFYFFYFLCVFCLCLCHHLCLESQIFISFKFVWLKIKHSSKLRWLKPQIKLQINFPIFMTQKKWKFECLFIFLFFLSSLESQIFETPLKP